DLDIGMNDWLIPPLEWDPARKYDRGKVMTAEELEAGVEFGRYLDVDGDGIPYRPLPEKRAAPEATKFGVLYFGSTTVAMEEAFEALEERGVHLDAMRLRGFPFSDDVADFIGDHERVF